jgi:hypothetical protein
MGSQFDLKIAVIGAGKDQRPITPHIHTLLLDALLVVR